MEQQIEILTVDGRRAKLETDRIERVSSFKGEIEIYLKNADSSDGRMIEVGLPIRTTDADSISRLQDAGFSLEG